MTETDHPGRCGREGQCRAREGPAARLRIARRAARPARHRDRRHPRQGRRLPRRHPLLGRRHRRHALRALSRRRRAARHLRQDRGLRRHPAADARHADRLAAYPLGQGRPEAAEAGGVALRPRLRRDELQHLRRRQGPDAFLQIRLAQPRRRRHAQAGGRAQSRMHRDRQDAGLQGADGVDRRRLEFPGPGQFRQGLRALSRLDARDLCRAAGRLAAVLRAQDVRAGLLFDRRAGLGHQLHHRAGARRRRPIASSTSATTRRTSTSR